MSYLYEYLLYNPPFKHYSYVLCTLVCAYFTVEKVGGKV